MPWPGEEQLTVWRVLKRPECNSARRIEVKGIGIGKGSPPAGRCVALRLAAVLLPLTASGAALEFTGTLATPESIFETTFTLSTASTVTFQTWGFGGGTKRRWPSDPGRRLRPLDRLVLRSRGDCNHIGRRLRQPAGGCGQLVQRAVVVCRELSRSWYRRHRIGQRLRRRLYAGSASGRHLHPGVDRRQLHSERHLR